LQALPRDEAEVIFLNDGPISPIILAMMRKAGEIVQRSKLGNVGSLREALTMPLERGWLADDLVWYSEDDYLYRPDALLSLVAAAKAMPEADYFGLYALIGNRQPNGGPSSDERVPASWKGGDVRSVDGAPWRLGLSTTSTFGARVRTISADRAMMLMAMRCGGAFDHTTCLAYQGFTPFPASFLLRPLREQASLGSWLRACAIAAARVGFNVYVAARRSKTPQRLLVASDPALATHMETAFIAQGFDWARGAAETEMWMEAWKVEAGASLPPPASAPSLSA